MLYRLAICHHTKLYNIINKWTDIPCSWIEIINIVKCPQYPKQPLDSVQSLSKYQAFFVELEQIILNCVWNHER